VKKPKTSRQLTDLIPAYVIDHIRGEAMDRLRAQQLANYGISPLPHIDAGRVVEARLPMRDDERQSVAREML